jgi:glycerol-3-phosphate dehydrogenase
VDSEVAVVGAGVVGCATALALARRGVSTVLLEAEPEPGLAASGTNSGVVHTGFDSVPGELETELILRSAELRPPLFEALGLPLLRCGAVLHGAPPELEENAQRNGVETRMVDGALEVPGESVTDPVRYTLALAAAAARLGAEVRASFRVAAISGGELESTGGDRVRVRVIVNCAGLYADEVARFAGDDSFGIYPRKGEFLVFDPPAGETLDRILLPLPTKRTKGVLVFPTLDGKVVTGPTAVDGEDKSDWSVRPEARDEILPKALEMWPPLEGATQVNAYAGLRPAGRDGLNYLIERSKSCESLVNVAAIRSTGLTASLGIAERVCGIVLGAGDERPLDPAPVPEFAGPWWRRTAEYRAG